MRKLLLPALVVGLLLGLGARVQAQDDARKLVEEAVKAYGGADKLEKWQATRMKSKGVVNLMGAEIDFNLDSAMQLPDKLKNVITIEIMGQKINVTQVYNGEKGWISFNGVTQEVQDKQLEDMKSSVYATRVNMLVPLLKDKNFKLSTLGDLKVNGKAATGIKVESKGYKEINLYFDKETKLIVKSERTVYDEQAMKDVQQEDFYSNFKEYEGIKSPTKLLVNRDGKKFLEGELVEMKHVDKIEEKEFGKPE